MGNHPVTLTSKHLIGAHVSIAGGISKAPERGAEYGCTSIQVFTQSPNQWKSPPLKDAECLAFKENMKKWRLRTVAAHDSYLINLASPEAGLWKRSIAAFTEEMNRCGRLGIPAMVMHPGSHKEAGEKYGLERVAKALGKVLDATKDPGVKILLETTAGQGNCLGYSFEHLADIMARLDDHPRLGVCFDTCHVFAAGYDIRTESSCEKIFKAFDGTVGLERLSLFHLNDSKGELGSRVDRHEHIGKGKIGAAPFRKIVRAKRFSSTPKIIETPGGVEGGAGDQRNLDLLFSYTQRGK